MSPAPKRILIRGVNWLGDAIMTTPALQRLRERFPEAKYSMLTHEKLAGLWEKQSWLEEVITFAAGESVLKVAGKLRPHRFDLGLVLPNSPRSAMELWLGGVKQRMGYGGRGRSLLLSQVVERETGLVEMRKRTPTEVNRLIAGEPDRNPKPGFKDHQLHHYLRLVGALGASTEAVAPRIEVTDSERAEVFRKFGVPDTKLPVIGINAGAEYGPAKRWPVARFIQASVEIDQWVGGACWFIFGGKGDINLTAEIFAGLKDKKCLEMPGGQPRILNFAGKTSLRELAVLLSGCQAVMTNDTGPMHLAAAVGAQVVALFGSTSPELTGPGLPGNQEVMIIRGDAPCQPCFLRECPIDARCLGSIGVGQVVEAVTRIVGNG